MNMFKNWHPSEVFWYGIVPAVALILLVLFGPKFCEAVDKDNRNNLFKECIEEHEPEHCRFLLEEVSR